MHRCRYNGGDTLQHTHAEGTMDLDRHFSQLRGSVTKLTFVIRAPAPDRAVGVQSKAVACPCRNCKDVGERTTSSGAFDLCRQRSVRRRPITQLAFVVVAPA